MLACSSFCFRLFQAGDNNIVVAPHSAVLLSAIFELAFQGSSSLRLHLSTRVHHPPPHALALSHPAPASMHDNDHSKKGNEASSTFCLWRRRSLPSLVPGGPFPRWPSLSPRFFFPQRIGSPPLYPALDSIIPQTATPLFVAVHVMLSLAAGGRPSHLPVILTGPNGAGLCFVLCTLYFRRGLLGSGTRSPGNTGWAEFYEDRLSDYPSICLHSDPVPLQVLDVGKGL